MGYIKLDRQIMDHKFWRGKFSPGLAWVDLLLLANYEDSRIPCGYKFVEVKRGQVFTSQLALAKRWKWDRKTVKRFLLWLESDRMLSFETDKRRDTAHTLITITNYCKFQDVPEDKRDIKRDNKVPSTSPSKSHQSGHIKEGKESKEVKEQSLPLAEASGHRNETYDLFAEAFLKNRKVPYQSSKADFVQLAARKKSLGLVNGSVPDGWQKAIENYFASPLSKYTLAGLCARYDVFLAGPIDRFGKPPAQQTFAEPESYYQKLLRKP